MNRQHNNCRPTWACSASPASRAGTGSLREGEQLGLARARSRRRFPFGRGCQRSASRGSQHDEGGPRRGRAPEQRTPADEPCHTPCEEGKESGRGSRLTASARRTRGLLPTLPVVRLALEMRDCHDHDFGSSEMVNDLVREGPHQHPPGRSTGANSRADLRAFCNQRHRGGDSVEELDSKSASTLLVPVNRFGELFRGRLDTAELTRHRPRMSLSMRRFTSSQGSSRAVPDSIAATRRWISVAHAASASGSAGPSRLASISAASSARASTSSRRASARTASAALVMAVILPCVSPPNKRVNLTVRSVTCPVMAAGRASPARRLRAVLGGGDYASDLTS